jgi:hypothetical protein
MIADLIIDFDNFLERGSVWRVELELPFQDAPEDVPNCINADVYIIAPDRNLALYIAVSFYPDARTVSIGDFPVTREQYVSRRNRS